MKWVIGAAVSNVVVSRYVDISQCTGGISISNTYAQLFYLQLPRKIETINELYPCDQNNGIRR